MSKSTLLLVDGDTRNLRVLEVSLRKAGYAVTAVDSGEKALIEAKRLRPSVVISDTQLPGMDGYELCQKLKSDPHTVAVPLIFLTREEGIEEKVRGLEMGVEEYLTKPIFIKELLVRIKMVLQRQQRQVFSGKDNQTTFRGNLGDMAVVDLIQTMELGRKSGLVRFMRNGNETAAIYFKAGRIIDAEQGDLKPEQAVYSLLGWTEGSFLVEFCEVDRKEVVQESNQGLLMEGLRRVDEWSRIHQVLPNFDVALEQDQLRVEQFRDELATELDEVLSLMDGRRTIQQIVRALARDDLELLSNIRELVEMGLAFDPATGPLPPEEALCDEEAQLKGLDEEPPASEPMPFSTMPVAVEPVEAAAPTVDGSGGSAATVETAPAPPEEQPAAPEPDEMAIPVLDTSLAPEEAPSVYPPAVDEAASPLAAAQDFPDDEPPPLPNTDDEPEAPAASLSSGAEAASDASPPEAVVEALAAQPAASDLTPQPAMAEAVSTEIARPVTAGSESSTVAAGDATALVRAPDLDQLSDSGEPVYLLSSAPVPVVTPRSTAPHEKVPGNGTPTGPALLLTPTAPALGPTVEAASPGPKWADPQTPVTIPTETPSEPPAARPEPASGDGPRKAPETDQTVKSAGPTDGALKRKKKKTIPQVTSGPKVAIDDAAMAAAARTGQADSNEASINPRDEAFFDAGFLQEDIDDAFDDEIFKVPPAPPPKGRSLALGLLGIGLVGAAIAVYFIGTSPYLGDGPAHLQVDPATLSAQAEQDRKQEEARRSAKRAAEDKLLLSSATKSGLGTDSGSAPTGLDGGADQGPPNDSGSPSPDQPASVTGSSPVSGQPDASSVAAGQPPPPAQPDAAAPKVVAPTAPPTAPEAPGYDALVKEGLDLLKKRQTGKALKLFTRAVELNPDGWEALQQLAVDNLERGRMAKAYQQAQKIVKLNPEAPYAHLVIGSMMHERGNKAAARAAYTKFLQLCPSCRFASDIRAVLKSL